MSKKDKYDVLASYLDHRLTRQDEKFFTPETIEKEDDLRKVLFLWDECFPAETGIGDTWSKIKEKIKEHDTRASRVASRRKALAPAWTWGGVASVVLVVTILLLSRGKEDFVPGARQYTRENVSGDEVKEVTLVVSGKKKIEVANNSKIAYSTTGEVHVNSERLSETTVEAKEEEYNQIIVPKGRRSMIVLADSSQIWINSGSQIVYPRFFGEGKRKIFVEGEVYLQVTRDTARPFVVTTSTFDVEVLGTSFNVVAYRERAETSVVLVEGEVEVKDLLERHVKMQPNERVEMNESGILKKENVNANDYITWVNGVWILDGRPLKEVLLHLDEYYGRPVYHDPSIGDEPVYGKLFLNDDLENVLESIRQALSVEDDGKMIFARN
jgi:ferric-dicitrate binding protein FerR (iron transport regulator)